MVTMVTLCDTVGPVSQLSIHLIDENILKFSVVNVSISSSSVKKEKSFHFRAHPMCSSPRDENRKSVCLCG